MQTDVSELFWQLLSYRDRTVNLAALGPWLQRQIAACSFPDLEQLPFETAAYTRNWIAKEQPGHQQFEALVMRWDRQVQTPIHGHPAFSFYYVISGVFEMEIYTPVAGNLQMQGTRRFCPSDTAWFLGEMGRYDNFIHRVRCLEPGHTFHIYSEDAQKGVSL